MRPSRIGTPNVTIRSVRISTQLRPRSHRSPMLIAVEVSSATGSRTRTSRSRSVYAAAEYTAIHSIATNSGQ